MLPKKINGVCLSPGELGVGKAAEQQMGKTQTKGRAWQGKSGQGKETETGPPPDRPQGEAEPK